MRRKTVQFLKAVCCFALLLGMAQSSFAQLSPQILDSAKWSTAYLPSTYRPADSAKIVFVNNDSCGYYETSPKWYMPVQVVNWYFEAGTYWNSWAGTSTTRWYARRTPLGSIGRANGGTANFRINIPTAANYVVYTYVCNTAAASDNAYFTVRKGTGAPADSMQTGVLLDSLRYNLLLPGDNMPTFVNLGLIKKFISQASDGAWQPMTVVSAPAGNKAITVTIGGDTLTNGPLRVDAIRVLRSSGTDLHGELEFGRRPRVMFDSLRVPEMFPLTTVGNKRVRQFKFFNLGSQILGVNSITSTNGQFSCSNVLPMSINPGQSAVINIVFSPTKNGTIVDTLVINNTDANEPNAKWYMVGMGSSPLFLTGDQTPGLQAGPGLYQPMGIDTSYYETPTTAMLLGTANVSGNDGIYNNSGSSCWGGTNRVVPNATGGGSPAGASGNYIFDIPSAGPYLIYVYLLSSVNNSDKHILTVKRFGEGNIADSVRFSGLAPGDNVTNFITYGWQQTYDSTWSATLGKYIPNPNQDGAWLPLSCDNLFQGNDAVTITWAADVLTPAYFRFDAVRLLHSNSDKSVEYGRREKLGFKDSRREPEAFPQTTLGDTAVKVYPFWSLGKTAVTVSAITGKTGRFSCSSPLPVTIQPGQATNVRIKFRPYQEEITTDTLMITSDDSDEPVAKWIVTGEGVNWNFILNASNGGVEQHYNAPGSPTSQGYSGAPYFNPIYTEIPAGTWLSSAINALFTYPIPGQDAYSRVYTGTGPAECNFKFMIPPVKSGIYLLEYNGPTASSNAMEAATVDLITPFRSDTQRFTPFNERTLAGTIFTQIGGGKPFTINGGDTTTIRFYGNNTQTPEYLRMDLLRVRKVPTKATIQLDVLTSWGDVSTSDSVRKYQQNYRKQITIGSVGETALNLVSVKLAIAKQFKLVNAPPANYLLPGVNGAYYLQMDFTPDSIAAAYVDTLIVTSSAPGDSIRKMVLNGNGVGTLVAVDNSDITTYVSPAGVVAYDPLDIPTQTKWQQITGSGYNGDRLLGRIYKMGPAKVEWFPNIPLLNYKQSQLFNFNVGVKIVPGSPNSSPAARYIVREAASKVDTFYINQNSVTASDSIAWLLNPLDGTSQVFQFRRGGRDTHGSTAIYGYVALENDTARVSKFYKDAALANVARDSGYYVRADAIVLNEVYTPGMGVEKINSLLPVDFALSQNYPNPFNPSTTIEFALPRAAKVSLVVYDILGREVTRLMNNDVKEAGYYRMQWNSTNLFGTSVATGVYFYRITAGSFVQTKKMLLLK
jgi:hypothetical protein